MYFQEREVKHIWPDREVKGNEGSFPRSYKIIHSPYLWTFKDLIQLLPTFGQMKDKSLTNFQKTLPFQALHPQSWQSWSIISFRPFERSFTSFSKAVTRKPFSLSPQVHSLTLSSALSTLNNKNDDKASGVLLRSLRNKPATSQAFAQLLLSFSERHSTLEVSTSRVTKSGA